jgi:hypothetical protein
MTHDPGLREVLMRVRASSLNYRDLMGLKGGGRGPTKLGVIPLSDGAYGATRVKVAAVLLALGPIVLGRCAFLACRSGHRLAGHSPDGRSRVQSAVRLARGNAADAGTDDAADADQPQPCLGGPTSPVIIGSAVAATVLLPMFIRQERRAPAPLIDLDMFRIPAFAGGILAIVLSYAMLYGIFFLMSFALVRGYHHSPLTAGLRLAIIPVALRIVAPFSGALHERLGVRTVLLSGMAICVAALMLLSMALTGMGARVHSVIISLAVFGAGLGMFIAPNNSATMSAAPRERSSEAGGMFNLMRVFGTSVGVAGASAVLSWRLAALTGIGDRTLAAREEAVLGGVRGGLLLLAAFAVIAGLTSALRAPPRTAALKAAA